MKSRLERCIVLLVIFFISLAAGCAKRPEAPSTDPAARNDVLLSDEPSPSPIPSVTVSYYRGDTKIAEESLPYDTAPSQVPAIEDARLLGWNDSEGRPFDPSNRTIRENTALYALTRPLLNTGAAWLFPDEHGFLLPDNPFTHADAAAALRSLMTDPSECQELLSRYEPFFGEPMSFDEFRTMLDAIFLPDQAAEVLASHPDGEEVLTRADAAWCIARLLDANQDEENYYPDVSPAHWAYRELSAAAVPGIWDRDTLRNETVDSFLWFDGYLYRLDDEGFFLTDVTEDDLYYGIGGRYTSGDAELDSYVAKTISGYLEPGKTRRELLRAVYLHVKNDFNYLVRNYYASGETGWAIPEAITMFETGKGNCYNYAGVFWSLARGLGYNAVTYSGTMGNQNQPHAWTEIILDGEIYICDPEIEMNYWWLAAINNDNSMYTDNFMMPRRNAGNWNYQAVGRQ